MSYTPDEIKMLMANHKSYTFSLDELMRDALALIQQLEAELSDAKNNHQHTVDIAERQKGQIDKLKKVVVRLNAERDAMISEIRTSIDGCDCCKNKGMAMEEMCSKAGFSCFECRDATCPCLGCSADRSNFEWRGVQKEE